MRKNNIFLICYGGGHINIIEPIVDELIKNENYNVKLLALTTAYIKVRNKYDKNILKTISDYLFLFDKNIDTILQNGLKIFEENYNESIGLSKLEVLSYLGLSYSESISKLGEQKANEEYKKIGRQSFLPIDTIKKILDYENIDLVITTNSPRFEKASLLAAKELNIKTIQIIDLFADDLIEQNANYTIVINEVVKNNLIKKGFDKSNVFALGQPAIEKSVKCIMKVKKIELYERIIYNIDLGKKILVYFSQPPIKFDKHGNSLGYVPYDEINPHIFKILDNLKSKYNIYFRLHPNEDFKNYINYFKKYPKIQHINDIFNLFETIALSDIVVTPYSTISIEAISCNKTVFTYKPNFSESFPVEYLKNQPFIYSNSYEELEKNLNNNNIFINDKSENNFLPLNFTAKFNELFEKNVF